MALIVSEVYASTNTNGFTTPSIDMSGVGLIAIGQSYLPAAFAGPGPGTITDNQTGNTYNNVTASPGDGASVVAGFRWTWCKPIDVDAAMTFSVSGSGNYPSLYIFGFDGITISGSAFDAVTNNYSTAIGSQPGSITPAGDNEILLIGVGHNQTSDTMSFDSGYPSTPELAVGATGGQNIGGAAGYQIQTSAIARNPNCSPSTSFGFVMSQLALKTADAPTSTIKGVTSGLVVASVKAVTSGLVIASVKNINGVSNS